MSRAFHLAVVNCGPAMDWGMRGDNMLGKRNAYGVVHALPTVTPLRPSVKG